MGNGIRTLTFIYILTHRTIFCKLFLQFFLIAKSVGSVLQAANILNDRIGEAASPIRRDTAGSSRKSRSLSVVRHISAVPDVQAPPGQPLHAGLIAQKEAGPGTI